MLKIKALYYWYSQLKASLNFLMTNGFFYPANLTVSQFILRINYLTICLTFMSFVDHKSNNFICEFLHELEIILENVYNIN